MGRRFPPNLSTGGRSYEWVVLDDCWHPTRDSNGTLVPDTTFFPNGLVPVIDFVHSLGLKFGCARGAL